MIAEHDYDITTPTFLFQFEFTSPHKMKLNEEYYVTQTFDMVGAIGGNLGVFIGFSFLDYIYTMLDYFKLFILYLSGNGKASIHLIFVFLSVCRQKVSPSLIWPFSSGE